MKPEFPVHTVPEFVMAHDLRTWLVNQSSKSHMRTFYNTLYILVLASVAGAQGWPSQAIVSPDAGLPPVARGHLWLGYSGAFLHDATWHDTRHNFNVNIGLANNVGLSLSGSARDITGLGAFQRGPEDSRLGLNYWPLEVKSGHLRAGFNTNFLLPTGFQEQQPYYDSVSARSGLFPAFSTKQTGGELFLSGLWMPASIAELNTFGGYFSTSDRMEQAFRWGSRMWLAPFGSRVAAELGFAQSFTRVGAMPNTQVMTSGLSITAPWGFQLAPGFSADLADKPVYGFALGIRFEGRLASGLFPEPARAPEITRHEGTILIAPPCSTEPLVDGAELWKSLQQEIAPAFDAMQPLSSLDQPGLPFDGSTKAGFWSSVEAIALANPDARWLLVTEIDHEAVAPAGGLQIPLLVSMPKWVAECHLRMRLVHLGALELATDRMLTARAIKRMQPHMSLLSDQEHGVLSLEQSRALSLESYRIAGRDIATSISIPEAIKLQEEESHALGDRR
jgi:hypothetical protein